MKERPILFSGPMVRAILENRKTQTRRIMKPQPIDICRMGGTFAASWNEKTAEVYEHFNCRYGQEGDRLWVKETWLPDPPRDGTWCNVPWEDDMRIDAVPKRFRNPRHALYKASWGGSEIRWKPSIHMPRWASRITLEITDIRTERLQDIRDEDAKAEGIEGRWHPDDPNLWTWMDYERSKRFGEPIYHYGSSVTPRSTYQGLWNSINGWGLWDSNPWVWVITFKRIEE